MRGDGKMQTPSGAAGSTEGSPGKSPDRLPDRLEVTIAPLFLKFAHFDAAVFVQAAVDSSGDLNRLDHRFWGNASILLAAQSGQNHLHAFMVTIADVQGAIG